MSEWAFLMWNSVGVALISSWGFPVTIFSVYFPSILQTLTGQKQIDQIKLNNVKRSGEMYLKTMRRLWKQILGGV